MAAMKPKRISADTLLDLAAEALRLQLGPQLPKEARYTAAMISSAIEMARREFAADIEAPIWALLDELYEPGEGSPRQLAREIRSGEISEAKNPDLAKRLLKVLEAELALVEPQRLLAKQSQQ